MTWLKKAEEGKVLYEVTCSYVFQVEAWDDDEAEKLAAKKWNNFRPKADQMTFDLDLYGAAKFR